MDEEISVQIETNEALKKINPLPRRHRTKIERT